MFQSAIDSVECTQEWITVSYFKALLRTGSMRNRTFELNVKGGSSGSHALHQEALSKSGSGTF